MKGTTKEMYSLLASYISKSDIYAASVIAKVSAFIINYRNRTGMTQKEFADYMGVSQGMVSKWESAEYNYSVESIAQIAEKLGYTFDVEFKPENEYLSNKQKIDNFKVNDVVFSTASPCPWAIAVPDLAA